MKYRNFFPVWLSLFVFLLSALPVRYADAGQPKENEFVVYGADFTNPDRENPALEPTIEAIQRAVYPQKVVVRTTDWHGLDEAIREKKASLIIGGASVYRRNIRAGLRDIATLTTPMCPNPDHSMGSVFYALKRDVRIDNLSDLKDKILVTNAPGTYRGELIPKKEILDSGFDPKRFFKKTIYISDPWERLQALEEGRADVLVTDACFAEEMARKGMDFQDALKVINKKENPYTSCVTSTSLYPGFSLLIPPNLDVQTIKNISQEIKTASLPEGYNWTIASDFTKADELYRELKIGPFNYLNSITLQHFLDKYKIYLAVLATLLLLLTYHFMRISSLVNKRTLQLRESFEREEGLRQKIFSIESRYRRRLQDQEVSQLCSAIAHDLSQPLSSVLLYTEVLSKQLKGQTAEKPVTEAQILPALEKIHLRAEKMNRVIQSIRDFCKSSVKLELIDLSKIVKDTVQDFLAVEELKQDTVEINGEIGSAKIYGSADQLELGLMNVLKNAKQAFSTSKKKKIFIHLEQIEERIRITVWDTGPKLSEEKLLSIQKREGLGTPSKDRHLGIGLNIIESIVCLNSGILDLRRSCLGGLEVVLDFPKAETEEDL